MKKYKEFGLYDPEYYNDLPRWSSYWFQIRNTVAGRPDSILEVGTGNKTVYNYLKSNKWNITSLDIDPERSPDVIGSVLSIPFPDNQFDVVLCAEVLEHLPFNDFEKALSELKRVSKKRVVLSLPHWGWTLYFLLRLPVIKEVSLFFKINGFIKHIPGVHFWEIGKRGYSLRRIRTIIKKYFHIRKDFTDYRAPYHHFFILDK